MKDGLLEKAGGASYLAGLSDGVPLGSTASVSEYSRIVKEKSIIRRLINASNNVIARCLEASEDPEALIDLAQSQVFEIAEQKVIDDETPQIGQQWELKEFYESNGLKDRAARFKKE